MTDNDIYRAVLLEHYKNPKNKGRMAKPDISKHDSNISCGDEVEIQARLDIREGKAGNARVSEIKFDGAGCVICMASASILSEELIGKSLKEIETMGTDDITSILEVNLTPTRLKCAMLPLVAIKKGIIEYESKNA